MTEEWRDVIGYEGSYEVSNLGNVRSVERKIMVTIPARPMKRMHTRHGRACMQLSRNNTKKNVQVSILVAEAFLRVRNGRDHNASRTHCRHGHELTPDNIYWHATSRRCKICVKASAKARKERLRRDRS
jgi:hypothetical protein